jgi:hydroxymethylpyrimidine pyrophosphatase-like HAD family hydrolase
LCNGSLIYDYAAEKTLREARMELTAGEVLEALREKAHLIRVFYVGTGGGKASTLYEDINHIPDEHLHMHALKVCCRFETPEHAEEVRDFALSRPELASCYICRSWHTLLEFSPCNATKGDAVDYIRNYLGNIHTAIGVGDYENDLTMLRHADIAATPSNGLDMLKREADMILKHCKEGAIKDLIERL